MKRRLVFAFIFSMFHSLAFTGNLTPLEQRIAEAAGKSSQEAITLLEKVVNINSGTMNHEGVAQVGAIFAEEFEALKIIRMKKD